ncbi:MAG: (Na+)-NQR maturation NqrM [Pseudomonadales bacterium]
MATFILTLCFLVAVTASMAVGVIFANRPIKGSCGGIQALGLGGECEICGGDPDACDRETGKSQPANSVVRTNPASYYDASKIK